MAELLLLILLLLANGVFSAGEMAIVSARRIRLAQWAEQGRRGAATALRLADAPEDFLSAVQIGITLIGIVSGTLGGASLAGHVQRWLGGIPLLRPYAEPLSFAMVVGLITYLSLVIGELVPKRLALGRPETIACRVADPMRAIGRLTAPLVNLLSTSTVIVLRLLGVSADTGQNLTEAEIHGLLEQGAQTGVIERDEQEMMSRILRLGDRPARSLMVPRTEIVWLDLDDPLPEIYRTIAESPYSRFPVCRESLDNCLGILRTKDLVQGLTEGHSIQLSDYLSIPFYVADSTRAINLLRQFKQSETHLALVTNEFGSIDGLLTLTNVVEGIVGELPNEQEPFEPSILLREDGSYLVDGLLSIDELNVLLRQDVALRAKRPGRFQTVGGLAMYELGRVPHTGDTFHVGGWRFEIVDMDGLRVDKVLVEAQPQAEDLVSGD